ncbi:MAG: J domain-containing protein [Lachnospiraceae bacterium]|nr:J domain-containing protein [Lachnospiraceae bacterium]
MDREVSRESLDEELREIEKKLKELELKEKLFAMKWGVLEDEVRKLAIERQQFSAWKESEEKRLSDMASEYERISSGDGTQVVQTAWFFTGIHNDESSLKKRYKELLKIYHPDNPDGDNDMVQEINREYDKLYERICG